MPRCDTGSAPRDGAWGQVRAGADGDRGPRGQRGAGAVRGRGAGHVTRETTPGLQSRVGVCAVT